MNPKTTSDRIATARQRTVSPSSSRHGAPPRMLLVDVSKPMRRLLVRRLKQSSPDIIVAVAGSVAEAVRMYDSLRPKTILLDLNLPDGSGLEVLRHAMALDPYCMIVVLTNQANASTRLECFEEGADFVFDKSDALERALEAARQASHREWSRTTRRPDRRKTAQADFVLANRSGLHVLPAARLVKLANAYQARIEIACSGRLANAKDMMEVLALGAECGARISVTATGSDAAQCLAAIRSLVAMRFHDEPPAPAPRRRKRPAAPKATTS